MGNACAPAKDAGSSGGDRSLVGQPDQSQSDPLLSKAAKNAIPTGQLKNFDLTFDATEEQQANAAIVLSFPLSTTTEAQDEDSVEVDPLEVQRKDLLYRLVRSDLQYSSMKSADGDEAFVIIEATEERLMECAECTGLEKRLKKSWEVPYAPFTVDRKHDFVWEDKTQGKVFSTRDRQSLIMRILELGNFGSADEMVVKPHENRIWKSKYGTDRRPNCGLNLDSYVSEGVLNGYWAMHGHSRRFELQREWGYKFFAQQPLKMIFEYFNSKVALYFAFTGYYSAWLAVSSIFGAVCVMYEMMYAKGEDDNILVAYFAFFMAMWGTLFLEFWKRYNAELAYRWSTTGLEMEASERTEFARGTSGITKQGFYSSSGHFVPYHEDVEPSGCSAAICSCGMMFSDTVDEDVDEVTRASILNRAPDEAPYMDEGTRCRRVCFNCGIALLFTSAVLCILMSFLVMRLIFQATFDAKYGAIMASTLQAAATVGLNVVYKEIAICMVNYENYRTDNEWEDAIVNKVFLFQFINSYFSLFYIAFLKGHIGKLEGYSDKCKDTTTGEETDNCMGELYTLLLSTLLTTQVLSTVGEALLPYFQYKLLMWAEAAKWKAMGNEGELNLSDIDHESKLTPAYALDTFNDYNKMAIQFGYVSMFVAAFPLAPVCALANNVLEIRTDALKRLIAMQRPTPSERAEDIGAWLNILEIMSLISVATNVGVLCFTSNQLTEQFNLTREQRVWLFVILEHTVIIIKLFVAFAISDVPEWVTVRLAKDQYMLMARSDIVFREGEALKKSQETLLSIGGVTLETDGAKAPMTSSGVQV